MLITDYNIVDKYIEFCEKQQEKPIICGEVPDIKIPFSLNESQNYKYYGSTVSTTSYPFNGGTSTTTTL